MTLLLPLDFEVGQITWWAGSAGSIPAGWALCDGTQGTPDLRDKFVVATSAAFPVGAVRHEHVHNHEFTGDGHTHGFPPGPGPLAGADYSIFTSADPSQGDTDNAKSEPPYYVLCSVMKL